ncbi:MAG: SpoIIE family protein phosphatase [Planctomycetota bacterium]
MQTEPVSMRFESISGPPIAPIEVTATTPAIFGRSGGSDVQLTDKTVSRKHCRIAHRGSTWFLTDLASRHGTYLNGIQLDPEQPAPLSDRDLVRLGPWTFRVRSSNRPSIATPTTNDLASTAHRVQRVPLRELKSVAQQRLDLLIDAAAGINAAKSLEDLADKVLDAVVRGTGFARAAFIRQVSATGDVEVIGFRGPEPPGGTDSISPDAPTSHKRANDYTPEGVTFSRSLINAASEGEIVRMSGDSGVNYGESIIRLGIHSALCAPVMLDASVEAFVYLDARDSEASVQADAAAFCQAVCRIAGLALSNLKRMDMAKHQEQLAGDLKAAREAQRLIMPPAMGTHGPYSYAMQTKPGREVAGDLFDVVELEPGKPNGKLAVFLGDVTGKGVGAAFLMATAQTHLRMSLRHECDPATVVTETNKYISRRIGDGLFISLWLGILDPAERCVRFVDAGHGHWLRVPKGGKPEAVECEGGLIVGVEEDFNYRTETAPFEPGDRICVFSDGLVEQVNRDGEQFGLERTRKAIAGIHDAREDVKAMARAVREHAETDVLGDDFTVASVHYTG